MTDINSKSSLLFLDIAIRSYAAVNSIYETLFLDILILMSRNNPCMH